MKTEKDMKELEQVNGGGFYEEMMKILHKIIPMIPIRMKKRTKRMPGLAAGNADLHRKRSHGGLRKRLSFSYGHSGPVRSGRALTGTRKVRNFRDS